jgi:hypothetical protein
MKRFVFLGLLCALVAPGTAHAQYSSRCNSDFLGGYRCYNNAGQTTTIRPDYMGGYNINYQNYNNGPSRCRVTQDYLGNYSTTCY